MSGFLLFPSHYTDWIMRHTVKDEEIKPGRDGSLHRNFRTLTSLMMPR